MNQLRCNNILGKVFYPEDGIALMMTLWTLVLLIAIAMEFSHSTRTEINTTKNFKEEIETYFLAEAGINLAIAEILQEAEYHTLDEENGEIEFGRKNLKDIPLSEYRKDIKLGNGSFSYSIEDDNGKLNLNIIPRSTITKMLELSGMGTGSLRDTIADSILDWKDKDNLHRFNGAEDDYYLSLSPPYECKDDFFDTVEELLWLKGMSKEILYGTENIKETGETNQNFIGIYDILTVQNIEFINPNTVDERVLEILYPKKKAREILNARKNKGRYDNSISSHFVVESTGFLNNSSTQRTIKVIFEKIGKEPKSFLVTKYWNDSKIR